MHFLSYKTLHMYAHLGVTLLSQWEILNISVPKLKCCQEIPTRKQDQEISCSVLQLFNGGTQGRVEVSQFRICIIYLYLVSIRLDFILLLRFNDLDVLIVTTEFTGTRGTYVFVFKETALASFQDIFPSTKSIFSN